MADDRAGVRVTERYRLEKFDERGELVEVIEGEERELGPEESRAMIELARTLPDRAATEG